MLLGPHWTHPRSSSTSVPDPATDFASLFSPTTPPSHQSRRAEQPSGLNLHQRIYRLHLYQEPPVLEPLSFFLPPPTLFRHPLPPPTITFYRLRPSCTLLPYSFSLRQHLVSLGSSFAVRSFALRFLYSLLCLAFSFSGSVRLAVLAPFSIKTPLRPIPSLGP